MLCSTFVNYTTNYWNQTMTPTRRYIFKAQANAFWSVM